MSDPSDPAANEHPSLKLGRRPPKNAPALMLADILTGTLPPTPAAVDHFKGATFALYGNDQYGDCGPVSVANFVRLVSAGLTGSETIPSLNDVFDLYRRSGNPNFNPETGEGDEGVDMQTMLEALHSGGIGDGAGGTIKAIAFAKVSVNTDAELDAAVAIFGGNLWGVTLETSQQAQTNTHPPQWDHHPSGVWGGHAVLNGKFEPGGGGVDAEVISWALDVETTEAFRKAQLEEAWVVIFPWHLDHPAFQAGVDLTALVNAYQALTGKPLPVPTPPKPPPSPEPPKPNPEPPAPSPAPEGGADEADRKLWSQLEEWSVEDRHIGENREAATAVREWAKSKGLMA